MSWAVQVSASAEKGLLGFSPPVQARILDKLEAAAKNPGRFFERLKGKAEWKLRVGDYRIIAVFHAPSRTIQVVHMDHRKRVYR